MGHILLHCWNDCWIWNIFGQWREIYFSCNSFHMNRVFYIIGMLPFHRCFFWTSQSENKVKESVFLASVCSFLLAVTQQCYQQQDLLCSGNTPASPAGMWWTVNHTGLSLPCWILSLCPGLTTCSVGLGCMSSLLEPPFLTCKVYLTSPLRVGWGQHQASLGSPYKCRDPPSPPPP